MKKTLNEITQMKKTLNEITRMQLIAGIKKYSQLNESEIPDDDYIHSEGEGGEDIQNFVEENKQEIINNIIKIAPSWNSDEILDGLNEPTSIEDNLVVLGPNQDDRVYISNTELSPEIMKSFFGFGEQNKIRVSMKDLYLIFV